MCCASWLLVYFFCQTLSNLVFTFQVYVREQIAPFVSTAELMKKFQTSTRDLFVQNRPKLTLTRPKEPEFVTSQRARPLRVKSSAELEEEMLAKIPKFKARPVNKKVIHLVSPRYICTSEIEN